MKKETRIDTIAEAKEMIKKDNQYSNILAEMYVPNIMETDKADKCSAITSAMIENRKMMIEMFGQQSFTAYNIAGKHDKLNALITGKNKNSIGVYKSKRSTGCYGVER